MKAYGSDNYSGVSPEIMEWLNKVNVDHVPSYGGDEYTQQALDLFKEEFGNDIAVAFAFNGTAANILSVRSLIQKPYDAVVTSKVSHLIEAEVGALFALAGVQAFEVTTEDGKITPDGIQKSINKAELLGFYASLPKIISIAQSTEFGVVYKPEEVRAITDYAHNKNMLVHMDGCRLHNAAASLDLSLRECTVDLGIDALSFGGTKNGLMFGDAVVLFNYDKTLDLKRLLKQSLNMPSKMRYAAAQFIPYLKDRVWHKNASNSNQMAKLLADGLAKIDGVRFTQKVETNQVFAIMPGHIKTPLQKEFHFYDWNTQINEVRFVTSFDTRKEEVEMLLKRAYELSA